MAWFDITDYLSDSNKLGVKNFVPLFLLLFLSDGCVDRLKVEPGAFDLGTLVVDGLITDQPGPYTIKLFLSSEADDVSNNFKRAPIKEVTIVDNAGTSEVLASKGEGVYQTHPNGIRGEVGRSYFTRVELLDGTIFESAPEEMKEVSEIDSLYFEWESFQPIAAPTQYGFRIFIDARDIPGENNYLRWKFSGAYEVNSFPELNWSFCNCCELRGVPAPYPCSGFEYTFSSGGAAFLKEVGDCVCCACWVSDFEDKPHVNDNMIGTNGTFKKVEMGYVPFDQWTFGHGKYMVKVEQMSLSREAFEFWKIFKDQKEGATSLFQPSFGAAKTNLFSTNSEREVIGIFQVSAVTKKILFLTPNDAFVPVPSYDIEPPEDNCALWRPCNSIFVNASTVPPTDWK